MQIAKLASAPLKVLVIDDEEGVRELCTRVISSLGCDPYAVPTGAEGLALIRRLQPEYVLLDVNLPDYNGLDILRDVRTQYPTIRIVMITGLTTVETAVEAMKLGAYDYLRKPNIIPQIKEILSQPTRPEPTPAAGAPPVASFCNIVGISNAMHRVFQLIDKAARSDSTVLIEGESGTGKELVARAIHARSVRASEPFVPVDCGAIAPSLIESELFGHVAGAFTDARTASPGLLRSAAGGTAFLDEIGELPTAVQVKLLRALQEMEVRPVGGAQAEPLKARIVAATNRDLNKAVALGQFRRDLFYRLHVIPIFVPPLRERREDVPLLVEHFARQCGEQAGRHISITPDALEDLMKQDWPGNVRELENLIARAFALLDGDTITRADLATLSPPRSADYSSAVASHAGAKADQPETGASLCGADYQSAKTVGGEPATPAPAEPVQGRLFDQCAAEAIRHALQEAGGNKRKAARVLGIGIATLYRKMKKYRIPG